MRRRFFFHIADGTHREDIDTEGVILEGPIEAKTEAVAMMGAMLAQGPDPDSDNCSIRVTDDTGYQVCELSFTATHGDQWMKHSH